MDEVGFLLLCGHRGSSPAGVIRRNGVLVIC
jgi:hypothetical protein